MKRWIFLVIILILTVASLLILGYFAFIKQHAIASPWQRPATLEEVADEVLADRLKKINEGETVDFGSEHEINVLVLGLDSRKGNVEPHCDAIHMFTLNTDDWSVHVTSVPRGTYAYIPPGNLPEHEYYLANACSYAGLDYGVSQIEKVVGVKADYVATVGFSQVLGIMRALELPTTESLQWLRHRQSYAIGDPQRSHNQAVFMRDLVLTQSNKLRGDFGNTLQYLLYSMVNTDMDYKVARALINGYLKSDIDERPDDFTLSMKPYHQTQDLHLDFQNPEKQIEELLEHIRPFLSDEDLSDRPLNEIQSELIDYLDERIASDESVADVVEKQLWLQVEDEIERERLHYLFIEKYSRANAEERSGEILDLLTEYIIEKEVFEQDEYARLGKELLGELIRVEL